MANVVIDLLAGCGGSHHILQGWAITRVAIITDIAPSGTQNVGQLLSSALNALIAVIGDRGDPCPDIPVATYLEQFIPEVITPEEVRVRIVYKGYPLPTYEFGGSLAQVESNRDIGGTAIQVAYTYPGGYVLDPRKAGQTIVQGGMVSKQIPEGTFTARFILLASGGHSATWWMMFFKDTYEGSVNNAPYSIGGYTAFSARTLLVTSVHGSSKDGGISYEVSMTFQFRGATWDQLVVYINPDDGKPPADLVGGTGYYTPLIYPSSSFPTFTSGAN